MKRITTTCAFSLLAATALVALSARADEAGKKSPPVKAEVDASLPMDGRIRELEYDKNDIYTMLTRVGYQSHIQFGVREEVDTISVGDRSFWQIIPAGNRLFIRPMADDVATNMTVITNKHSYQFDLQSTSDPDKKIIYVARFVYPNEIKENPVPTYDPFMMPQAPAPAPVHASVLLPSPPPVMAAEPAPNAYPAPYVAPRPVAEPMHSAPEEHATQPVELTPPPREEAPAQPVPLLESSPPEFKPLPAPANPVYNQQYTFTGPEEAAPYAVFDDGLTTHLLYQNPPRTLPLISMVDANGQETPVTVYQKDGYIAVDVVTSKLAVRTEGATVYVFNETLPMKN